MYCSVFTSSEYYSDEDINREVSIDEDELCLICWLPEYEKNRIKLLSEFSHIKPNCKCKPKIHLLCINEWIAKSQSCPICRIKMDIIFTNNIQNVLINYYIICVSYTVHFLKIVCYASFINLICILFYNTYFIYIITNKYYENDYGIY